MAQVRLWSRQTRKSHAVPGLIARPYYDSIAWQPDNSALYVRALPEHLTIDEANLNEYQGYKHSHQRVRLLPAAEHTSSNVNPSPSALLRAASVTDLAKIDVLSLRVIRIIRKTPIEQFSLSPDGKRLAFMGASYKSDQSHEFWVNRIVLVDTHVYKETTLADSIAALGHLMWSPDSTMLAHISEGAHEPCDLTIYDAMSATESFTTYNTRHPRFGFSEDFGYNYGSPLWTPDSARLVLGTPHEVWVWERARRELRRLATLSDTELVAQIGSFYRSTAWLARDGHSVGFTAIDPRTKDAQIYTVDVQSGKAEKIFQRPVFFGTPGVSSIPDDLDMSDEGKTIYAVIQASDRPPSIYRFDRRLVAATEVIALNQMDQNYKFGATQLVEWAGLHHELVQGALLLPGGYERGHRYPLIVYQYPFFRGSRNLHAYGLANGESSVGNWQFFATRGYAVLVPDLPLGSMRISEIAGQLERAVDHIVDIGIADPHRVGINGESMGGHTCIAAIEGTDRFSAAVCENAVWVALAVENFDLSDQGTYVTGIGYGIYSLGGSFWKNKQTFFENDLLFNADRIKTPLLLIRGDLDFFPINGDSLYVALRDLKQLVSYVRYANVDHDLRNVPPYIRRDYLSRVAAWFDQYLRGKPAQ